MAIPSRLSHVSLPRGCRIRIVFKILNYLLINITSANIYKHRLHWGFRVLCSVEIQKSQKLKTDFSRYRRKNRKNKMGISLVSSLLELSSRILLCHFCTLLVQPNAKVRESNEQFLSYISADEWVSPRSSTCFFFYKHNICKNNEAQVSK